MRPVSADSARESVQRFDLNVQRRHVVIHAAGLVTAIIGAALHVFPLKIATAVAISAAAAACSGIYYWLYRRGIDRRILNPLWMATDVVVVTAGIYATGGLPSPWFIWY